MFEGIKFCLGMSLAYKYVGSISNFLLDDSDVTGLTLDDGVVKRKYQGYFADDSTFFNSRLLNDDSYFSAVGGGDFQITALGTLITPPNWYDNGFFDNPSFNNPYEPPGAFPHVGSGLTFAGFIPYAVGSTERAAVSRPLLSQTFSSVIDDGYSAAAGDNNKSLIVRGYFKPTISGEYSFRITSDDASYLWLGSNALDTTRQISNAIVSNGGLHGPSPATGTFTMTADAYYALAIMFGNGPEGEGVLTFEYLPPGASEYTTDLTGKLFYATGTTGHGQGNIETIFTYSDLSIEYYPNTIIPDSLQNGNSNLTSVVFGDSITSIGSYAFHYCSGFTGSLTIPDSVTSIGSHAFRYCSGLSGSLTLPDSVTSIGTAAFQDCYGLTGTLILPTNPLFTSIESTAFRYCSGLSGSLTIPDSVTSIGQQAFQNCSGFTGSLTIPNSVTSIGVYAFSACFGFTGSLTIPDSVTSIGAYAFVACYGLTGTLTLPTSPLFTSIGSSAFSNSSLTGSLVIPDSVTTIESRAFAYCPYFDGSLNIGNSVTSIGSYAFSYCSGLIGSLTIPDSVTSIGAYAFSNCSGFDGTLTLPTNPLFTSIESHAFSYCSGFTGSLTIPDSVTSIAGYAFNYCSGFTTININCDPAPVIGSGAFSAMTSVSPAEIHVPIGATGYATDYDGLTVVYDL